MTFLGVFVKVLNVLATKKCVLKNTISFKEKVEKILRKDIDFVLKLCYSIKSLLKERQSRKMFFEN